MQTQMVLIDKAVLIEKNVPIPSIVRKRTPMWPFAQMEVGESFFAPGYRTKNTEATQKEGFKGFTVDPKKIPSGWKFTVRNWVHNNKPGVRVWRVE